VAPQKKRPEADALTRKDEAVGRATSSNSAPETLARNRAADGNAIGGIAPSSGVAVDPLQNQRKEKSESKGAFAGAPAPASPQLALPLPRQCRHRHKLNSQSRGAL
jgi:hypothetical protein